MIRLAFTIIAGVLLGLIVHLVAVLALPRIATQDAYSRLTPLTKLNAGVDGRALARTVADADGLLVSGRQAIDKVTPEAVALMTDARRVTGIVTEDRVDRAIGVADKAADAVGKAGGLIDNVDGLVTDLRQGKGTAGALLVKDDVYLDVRELLRDLKRNPWKFFWKE